MSGRDAILGRVRRAIGAAGTDDQRQSAMAARRNAGQTAPAPEISLAEGAARIDQFEAKARAADATVSRVSSVAALPEALSTELRNRNLPQAVRTGDDPAFADLDWRGVDVSHGKGRMEEPATLSRAEFAMAETGTLVLASGPDNPVTLTFLGETHFVALPAADVKGGFEDMWAALRERGLTPRTVNMVTGPSRSADIGQTLQLGAHGPVALHIFIIED